IGGELWIRNSFVYGKTCANKAARIYFSQFSGPVTINGEFLTQNSCFSGDVSINRDITAQNNKIICTLSTTAEIICLCQVMTNNIYIYPTGPDYDHQTLFLKKGTIIDGSVNFFSNRGKIVMDPSCLITGPILGGNVIEPFECYLPKRPE